MPHNPVLSPTHADNDLLILDGVLAGVVQEGARYGLSHARRDLLATTLQTLMQSMREGWEAQFRAALQTIQAGRPSQPASERRGDTSLPDSCAERTR